ncbi:AT-rich interactive domain-containing protein 1B-like isoform X2 [Sitophilus oryzae]|uniref:AT-rich interactive domain-containing protein 1B-like isoform X2 n=1 Tax=Sitophilus oryzae TaxID=7048 RepID=A0A6J2YYI6_SITOR|nr:AT-rich interactive domain-containing protein 1B-like isoform X2 [Sitophilus oryzae]
MSRKLTIPRELLANNNETITIHIPEGVNQGTDNLIVRRHGNMLMAHRAEEGDMVPSTSGATTSFHEHSSGERTLHDTLQSSRSTGVEACKSATCGPGSTSQHTQSEVPAARHQPTVSAVPSYPGANACVPCAGGGGAVRRTGIPLPVGRWGAPRAVPGPSGLNRVNWAQGETQPRDPSGHAVPSPEADDREMMSYLNVSEQSYLMGFHPVISSTQDSDAFRTWDESDFTPSDESDRIFVDYSLHKSQEDRYNIIRGLTPPQCTPCPNDQAGTSAALHGPYRPGVFSPALATFGSGAGGRPNATFNAGAGAGGHLDGTFNVGAGGGGRLEGTYTAGGGAGAGAHPDGTYTAAAAGRLEGTYTAAAGGHPNATYITAAGGHPNATYTAPAGGHPNATYTAAAGGHPNATYTAAAGGHPNATYTAAAGGHPNATYTAAAGGHPNATYTAAAGGHPNATYIAAAGGHPNATYTAAAGGHPNATYTAAAGGHPNATYTAAAGGHPNATYTAAAGGHPNATYTAAAGGRPDATYTGGVCDADCSGGTAGGGAGGRLDGTYTAHPSMRTPPNFLDYPPFDTAVARMYPDRHMDSWEMMGLTPPGPDTPRGNKTHPPRYARKLDFSDTQDSPPRPFSPSPHPYNFNVNRTCPGAGSASSDQDSSVDWFRPYMTSTNQATGRTGARREIFDSIRVGRSPGPSGVSRSSPQDVSYDWSSESDPIFGPQRSIPRSPSPGPRQDVPGRRLNFTSDSSGAGAGACVEGICAEESLPSMFQPRATSTRLREQRSPSPRPRREARGGGCGRGCPGVAAGGRQRTSGAGARAGRRGGCGGGCAGVSDSPPSFFQPGAASTRLRSYDSNSARSRREGSSAGYEADESSCFCN